MNQKRTNLYCDNCSNSLRIRKDENYSYYMYHHYDSTLDYKRDNWFSYSSADEMEIEHKYHDTWINEDVLFGDLEHDIYLCVTCFEIKQWSKEFILTKLIPRDEARKIYLSFLTQPGNILSKICHYCKCNSVYVFFYGKIWNLLYKTQLIKN